MITILLGASGCGKNYIESILVNEYNYERVVSCTTRPMRDGELEGREYNFIDKTLFLDMIRINELIEYRTYNTLVDGIADTWYYGIRKQPFYSSKNYVVILDVQGAVEFIDYVGESNVEAFLVNCSDDIRTTRDKARGGYNAIEAKRRLIDDAKIFSKNNMKKLKYCIINNDGKRNINDVIKEII